MKILPPAIKFSRTEWMAFLSGVIGSAFIFIAHFSLEYLIVIKSSLPLVYLILPYFTIPFGVILSMTIFKKVNHYLRLVVWFSCYVGTFICILLLIENQIESNSIIIILGYFLIGIFVGGYIGDVFWQIIFALGNDPEFNGRSNSLGYIVISILVIFITILYSNNDNVLTSFGLLILIFTLIISTYFGMDKEILPTQKLFKFKSFFTEKKNISNLTVSFLVGLFTTIPFYSAALLMDHYGFLERYSEFVLVFWIIVALTAFFNGLLLDIIGRRLGIILGFCLQSLAFVLFSFDQSEFMILIILPIIFAIGFISTIGFYLFLFENTPAEHIRDAIFVNYLSLDFGMLVAIIFAELIKDAITRDPILLSVILMFFFIIAIMIIFQLEEKKPSKDELEWRKSVRYLTVLFKSGLPVYNQNLSELQSAKSSPNELLGGALVAISALLQEIAQDKEPLKIVKKEGFSIMIEEGEKVIVAVITTKELKTIRKKMKNFLDEFQIFFSDFIQDEIANTQLFTPSKALVSKYFGER